MGRRTLLVIAALIVAALGTVLVFLYAQNAKNTAQAGQTLVTVLVAKNKIEIGTTGSAATDAGDFQEQQIAQDSVVTGALSSAAPLANLVALVPIYPGQQIISQQWGATATTNGLAIPNGEFAITVSLQDTEHVASFVQPGSTVAIFTTGAPAAKPTARLLLASVPVLAVGATTPVNNGSSSSQPAAASALFTLGLTQDQVQKILLVTKGGGVYNTLTFALLGKDAKAQIANPGTTNTTLIGP